MPKVEPIKVLTVDEVPMNVADLSDAVKQLVEIFDDWNQKEADARSHSMMVSAAKDTLSRQIIGQIRKDKSDAEAAEAAVAEDNKNSKDVATKEFADAVVVTGDAAE